MAGMGPLANLAKLLKEKEELEKEVEKDDNEIEESVRKMRDQNYQHLTVTNLTEANAARYFAEQTGWTGNLAIIAGKKNIGRIKKEAHCANFTSVEEHHKD